MLLNGDPIAARARIDPARVAIVDVPSGRRTSYGELSAAADSTADALAAGFGVGRGDRVAVLARTCPEQVELLLAAARLGAILVPLNWRLAPPELVPMVRRSKPRVIFADAIFEDAARTLAKEDGLPVARLDSQWRPASTPPAPRPAIEAGTPLLILFTSGSTGHPKGAVLTHGSVHWNAINTILGWELSAADSTLIPAPLFHTGGWNVLLLPLLSCGGTVHLAPAFDAGEVLAAIERERLTVLFAVPTMLASMRESPAFGAADLSSLRWIVSGGAPCPVPLIEAWWDRGVALLQGYGLTEVGPNCFMMARGDGRRRAGGVGFPMPWLQVRLASPRGAAVPDGEAGELLLRGPTVCDGYWDDPGASASALCCGWFATGDLFVREPDGWFRCVGRCKEMFISGGENVYPVEVERVLCGLPGVIEAAVVGVPDSRWGEVGCAFIAFRAGQEMDGDEVRRLCRQDLAGYKVPRRVRVLAELPKGPTGKIDKAALYGLALSE